MSGLTIITQEDRTGNGNLLPEAEERIVNELVEVLPDMEVFSVNAISSELRISHLLAKRLRKRAIEKWKVEHAEEVEFQKEKIRRYLDEIEHLPPNCSRVQQIRNQIATFEKLHELEKVSPTIFSFDDSGGEATYIITGKIGPNMLKLFEERRRKKVQAETVTQDGATDNHPDEGGGEVPTGHNQ